MELTRLPRVSRISGHRPGRRFRQHGLRGKLHRLHHLAHKAIRHHHHRRAIAVGQVESQRGQVRHLLRRVGRQHNGVIAAVAAALHHLVIIALLGGDVAQPWPAARNVGDDAGQLRSRHVADAFLHQADAGPAGRGHASHSGRGGAVKHVDGRNFTLGLQKHAAGLRHVERRRLGNLAGRSNGIAIKRAASGQNGALHQRIVALHQLPAHARAPSAIGAAAFAWAVARYTVIAPGSGQAMKQMPHPCIPRPRTAPCDSRSGSGARSCGSPWAGMPQCTARSPCTPLRPRGALLDPSFPHSLRLPSLRLGPGTANIVPHGEAAYLHEDRKYGPTMS